MATKTFEELKQLAIQIRDEKTNKANTATRIGTQMIEHLNKLEQEYYNKDDVAEQLKTRDDELARLDKMTTEYNVSVLHPTSGSGGSNKYTLETAIAQVPSKYRSVGIKCAFINDSGKPECWKYQGGSWVATSFVKEADGGNKILKWVTDVATTRKQVALSERKTGMQISYNHPGLGKICEQYIGTNLADTYWAADGNWDRILTELDYEKRGYSVFKEFVGLKNETGNLIGSSNSEYAVQYTDISDADYIDAIVRSVTPTQGGITFWDTNKSKIKTYLCNEGQYIDGNNFRFFLKKPVNAKFISVGAYQASDDINYLKLIKTPTGNDIIDLDKKNLENSVSIQNINQELSPIKKDAELITVIADDYTRLIDKNGISIDSNFDFAPNTLKLIPIKDCTIIEWCAKVFAPTSPAVRLYGKDHKTAIKEIIGTDGSKIENSIYAGTIDLSSDEFSTDKPYYVAIGCYLPSGFTDKLYLRLLKKLPKDAITGVREPIINYMGAVRVNNITDYFTNYWGKNTNKWWYNIGNDLYAESNTVVVVITAQAKFSRNDLDNLGLSDAKELFIRRKFIGKLSRNFISISDGTTTVEHGFNKPNTNVLPYYGEDAVRIDVSSLDLKSCKELTVILDNGFQEGSDDDYKRGITEIGLFKEMYYGDRPIVSCDYKSSYCELDEYTFFGQEELKDAVEKVRDGGTLYIREGDYIINEGFVIKKSINIIGNGKVRLLGGKMIKSATPQGTDNVYTLTVNNDEVGYVGGTFIYQHDIPDKETLIPATERMHLYDDNQQYRLPSTRIWKTDDISKVLTPQENGRLYYHIDTNTNLMTFRISDGSSLQDNPVFIYKRTYSALGSLAKADYNIVCSWDNIMLQNITNMYSALSFNGFNNLIVDNVKVFCVANCPVRVTTNLGVNNRFSRFEVGGGFEDGLDFGQPIPIEGGLFARADRAEFSFENCWFHDNFGDGISEHGNPRAYVRDSVFEYNGISGATPAGGETLYVNCIFRRNGWDSGRRGGLQVLPADTNSHVVCIGCVSVDNQGDDYSILSSIHTAKDISLQLYNCVSLQTDDTTNDSYALSGNVTAGRKGVLGLYNFVTNRKNKWKGSKDNITIVQAPTVID